MNFVDAGQILQMFESSAISFDFNGHFKTADQVITHSSISLKMYRLCAGLIERLVRASTKDASRFQATICGQAHIDFDSLIYCDECGQELVFRLKGHRLTATSVCPFPQGVPLPFTASIEIADGQLVFGDYFGFLPRPQGTEDLEYHAAHQKIRFEKWCAAGFPKAACGNSCPSIYQKGNQLVIATGEDLYSGEGYSRVFSLFSDSPTWQFGELTNLRKVAGERQFRTDSRMIAVEPGTYLVRLMSWHCDRDGPEFARIERVDV